MVSCWEECVLKLVTFITAGGKVNGDNKYNNSQMEYSYFIQLKMNGRCRKSKVFSVKMNPQLAQIKHVGQYSVFSILKMVKLTLGSRPSPTYRTGRVCSSTIAVPFLLYICRDVESVLTTPPFPPGLQVELC